MRTESLAPRAQAKDTAARTLGYHPSLSLAQARTTFTEPVNRCARDRPGTPAPLTAPRHEDPPTGTGTELG